MKKQLYANTTDEKYTTMAGSASKTDKLILEQLMHRYDEECKRFDTVDGKLSSMIGVLATIFTLQTSLFALILGNISNLLTNPAIIIYIIFGFSEFFYLYSAYCFIQAHTFETKYKVTPDPELLMELGGEGASEEKIVRNMIGLYSDCIETNYDNIELKANKGKDGFKTLKIGLILSFILIISLICFKYFV